jgi:predicted RNA methylase
MPLEYKQSNQPINFPPPPPVGDRLIYDLLWRGRCLPMVAFAFELGVFDRLSPAPLSTIDLAEWLGVEPRAAEAMTGMLAAAGFLQADSNGKFSLTETSKTYLCSNSPHCYEYLISYPLPELETLRKIFENGGALEKTTMDEMPELSSEDARPFIRDMHRITLPAASALGAHPIWKQVNQLLDVGGGSGTLSCGIAKHHPAIQCTIFDLPGVCELAQENINQYQMHDQVKTVSGDMFTSDWPEKHDGVLFGNIFHDWELERCTELAAKTFHALPPGGSIYLHEMLLNEKKDGPFLAACFSVNMLLYERGKQFTLSEIRTLLEDVGFVEVGIIHTFSYYSLISARKPARR